LGLLLGAYSPVALIIAARVVPEPIGWISLGIGVLGAFAWVGFLTWAPHGHSWTSEVADPEPVDTEVTAYIVSLLLPIVAAVSPDLGDVIAYCICGALILFVAYVSDLAAFNPFVYIFGYRVLRAEVDGEPAIVLSRDPEGTRGEIDVVRALGVTVVLGRTTQGGGA
jgi:hypothetical protein